MRYSPDAVVEERFGMAPVVIEVVEPVPAVQPTVVEV